ncbi:MAG: S41 family peptidase [Bacteroidota bacterium]
MLDRKAMVLPKSSNDYGALFQTIKPEDIKSKKISAKAKIRISSTYQGTVYLGVRFKAKDQPWDEVSSETVQTSNGTWVEVKLEKEVSEDIEKATIILYSICKRGYIDLEQLSVTSEDTTGKKDLIREEFNSSELGEQWKTFGPNQNFEIFESNNEDTFVRISRSEGNNEAIEALFPLEIPKQKIVKKELTNGLLVSFPVVLPLSDSITFPKPSEKLLTELNQKIDSIDPSEEVLKNKHVRLANIIKVWNVFQHFYPYFEITEVNWENELRLAIERNKTDKNKSDHIITLKKMVSKLNDSHIGVYSNNSVFFPPFAIEKMENQLVITSVNDSVSDISQGDIVKLINGIPSLEYWENTLQLSSGANSERKNYKAIYEALVGDLNDSISLTILGKESPVLYKKQLTEEEFEDLIDIKPKESYFEAADGIKYIDLSKTSWAFIQEKFDEISSSNGLIFDLRGYPQWQTIEIVRHFTQDTLDAISTYEAQIQYPDRMAIKYVKEEPSKFLPMSPYLKAPRIFLTNARAISYAETFLNVVSHYNLATIVGSQTAGSTGNTNDIFLYGNILIPWTGKRVADQNGNIFHGIGIQPDYEVNKTIEGVKKNKDEIYEYAVKLLTDQRDAFEQKR